MSYFGSRIACSVAAALIGLLVTHAVHAADPDPLSPVDTSSPQGTLQGFVATVDQVYTEMAEILREYEASKRLYLTTAERRRQFEALSLVPKAIKVLDLSDVPPVLRDTVGPERALQLKEVLDRIGLPSSESIPDAGKMAHAASKRWRLPGTEIDVALVEGGSRSGEWLVSADTVARLPEFYERVKRLPYKPGPAAELIEVYRRMSSNSDATIHDAFVSSPVGLERIVPIRWMLAFPTWAKARVAGVQLWQWLGLLIGFVACAGFVYGVHRLGRILAERRPERAGPKWQALLTPLAVILVSAFPVPLLCAIFRIGGMARVVITLIQTGALYAAAAWLSMIVANLLAEAFVASEHLKQHSLDSQLVRLGMRFVGIGIAAGFLIQGSYELGFPTYSVIAGLGVGGLAVALAARDSLANLLGSMLIMMEKPFRVGHNVKVSGGEGTVEDVGFRSTRIRTSDNSLVSIPNNSIVNATIENLSLRSMRRQRFLVQVTYDTPRGKIEELVAAITRLLAEDPMANKDNIYVRFNDFGESSLNILVVFYLETTGYSEELEKREKILLSIMKIAEQLNIEFAFPTRTLVIEATSETRSERLHAPVLGRVLP
ncbi:MAG: mechanosensitive ion channel family protein [Hyphomicrobiales bacterium]|nr:mechanosensitive ion channel family protein [Hyphomicrobiales bacterium]